MTKLNDTHTLLLSHASQASNGSLCPLPSGCQPQDEKITNAVTSLKRRKLVEERETNTAAEAWRITEEANTGLYITPAGLIAIGVDEGPDAEPTGAPAAITPAPQPRTSKIAGVLTLLGQPEGATLAELIAATGWLPHTTRAALTGLRKKGHAIERFRRDDATCYRIAEVR